MLDKLVKVNHEKKGILPTEKGKLRNMLADTVIRI